MASLADIEEQIGQANTIISGATDATIASGLALSLASQIGAMPELSYPDATRLSAAFASSRFDVTQQTALSKATLERALRLNLGGMTGSGGLGVAGDGASTGATVVAGSKGAGTQLLENPAEYHTEGDYYKLDVENLSMSDAVIIGGDRLNSVGVFNASEITIKNECALLACFIWKSVYPTSAESYSLSQLLKQQIKAGKERAGDVEGLAVYPPRPAMLPPALRAQAYSDDDPPVCKVLQRFVIMRQKIVMRPMNHIVSHVQEVSICM